MDDFQRWRKVCCGWVSEKRF